MVQINVELLSSSGLGGVKKVVQCTPSMGLADILLTACQEMKVDPGVHVLRHKKKDVDLTLPFRLANIPNNATLELFELEASVAAKRVVSVSLQCEGGKRATIESGCGVTLLELLTRFEDRLGQRLCTGCKEKGETPSVTFMNRAFEGEDALRSMTLLQLGIVSGNALLRHTLKGIAAVEPENKDTSESASAPAAQGEGEEHKISAESTNHVEESEGKGSDSMDIDKPNGAQPMERQWTVGRPRESAGHADLTLMEVDDSIFEVTAQDLQLMEAHRKEKESASNMFKTKKMREQEREARLAKFSECPVRVVFPDQTWIQSRFTSQETLADIYTFVKGTLSQDRAFYLYTTPPPTKLPNSKDSQIKYTQLLPAAKIYFSWNEPPAGEPPFMAFKYLQRMEELETERNAEREREEAARQSRAEAQQRQEGANSEDSIKRNAASGEGESEMKDEGETGAEDGATAGATGKATGGATGGSREGTALDAAEKRAASNQARGVKQPKWFAMKK